MESTRYLMGLFALAASFGAWSCAGDDTSVNIEQLDVTGEWRASMDGTVFHNESGAGERTTLTLTLTQSGTNVTGSYRIDDTLGRTATKAVSGTVLVNTVTFTGPDVDPLCAERIASSHGTVSGDRAGSTMSVHTTAPAKAICPALAADLTYTKQ